MKARSIVLVAALATASSVAAAPKIEHVLVKPNPAQFAAGKAPEVEVAVSVTRSRFDSGGCDVRVEFGDGEGRTVDFGVASTRTLRHVYKKGGSYSVLAKGTGASPCDGTQQVALTVAGAPEPEKKAAAAKPEAKKASEKKKAEPKKKAAPQKKAPAKKKPPAKKKADDKKKAEEK